MRIVVGVTGASGAIYAQRALELIAQMPGVDADLVFTKTGRQVWAHEIGGDVGTLPFQIYSHNDMSAPFASGSARYDGMMVIPCSSGSLARMAHGLSIDLIGRAADVMLKERRPLVLVLRETPLSLVHLRNMTQLVEAGATVLPASPSFYTHPKTMLDIVDTVVSRAFDQLGIHNELVRRWSGREDASGD